jgi:hypothetical protein
VNYDLYSYEELEPLPEGGFRRVLVKIPLDPTQPVFRQELGRYPMPAPTRPTEQTGT